MPTPLQQVGGQTPGSAQASITTAVSALSAGSAVFVAVVWNTKSRSLASVTATGCTFTQVISLVNTSAGNLNLWVAYNVGAGATSIVANINTGTSQGVMQVLEVPGLKTATDNSASLPNTTAGTAQSISLTPVDTTDQMFYVGALGLPSNLVATQTGTGFTESTADTGISGSRINMAYGTFASGGASQTVSWSTPSSTVDGRGIMSVPVAPSGIVLNAPLATGQGTADVPSGRMTMSEALAMGQGIGQVPGGVMMMREPVASGQGQAFAASVGPIQSVILTRPYWRQGPVTSWSEKGGLL